MTPNSGIPWKELLAAYLDGELEGRDELAGLRERVESWLARHPDALAELADYRRLRHAWQETSPPEPSSCRWNQLLMQVRQSPQTSGVTKARQGHGVRVGVLVGMAASILFMVLLFRSQPAPQDQGPLPVVTAQFDEEPFPVAAAHEVVILSVEGADTHSLVVGLLPLHGMLELAGPNDVTFTSIRPDARDNMVPEVRTTGSPMIWARLETEEDE